MTASTLRVRARSRFSGHVIFALGLAVTALAPNARADQADDAFDAWNSAFLVKTGGDTFYSTTAISAGTTRSGTWVGALDIAVAEDYYEHTHLAVDRTRVNDLVTTFVAEEGTDWKGDTWDDDIAWMVIALLRGYQLTGNDQFLTIAENNWNMAYARGWDTKYGGGGVWEDLGHVTPWNQPSKCNLSNNPLIKTGVVLYRVTGDSTYLDKCKGMYAWIREKLFDPNTGLVNECLAFKTTDDTAGFVQNSDNAYNSGSFLEAADALYRATGEQSYLEDATIAISHRLTKEPILHDGGQGERQWGYRFVKGLAEFSTYHNQWSKYQTWLENNANAAWSQRDALGVTWNDWTKLTPAPGANGVTHDNDVVPLCTSSAAAIWSLFPAKTPPSFNGDYELKNSASGLSLGVASSDSAAAVVQTPFNGDASSLWSFVPTAGGYYQIKNKQSGLVVDVAANSAQQAAAIVQAAPETHAQGTDQWLPFVNSDGSYTFYNLSSMFALDDPMSSTTPGTALDQWAGNDTNAQKFTLISHADTDAGVGGATASGGGSDSASGGNASSSAGTANNGGNANGGANATGASSAGLGGNAGASAQGGSTAAPSASDSSNGCSCRVAGSSTRASLAAGLLALLGMVAVRRRRARR